MAVLAVGWLFRALLSSDASLFPTLGKDALTDGDATDSSNGKDALTDGDATDSSNGKDALTDGDATDSSKGQINGTSRCLRVKGAGRYRIGEGPGLPP